MVGKERQQEAPLGAVVRPGWSSGRVFRFDVPMPPSANTYYRTSNNIVHLSAKARQFRQEVLWLIPPTPDFPLRCRLDVEVILHFPTRRRCDIDNRIKPLLDSLEHANVFEDDNQVDSLRVTRSVLVPGGRCVVFVTEMIPDTQQQDLPL